MEDAIAHTDTVTTQIEAAIAHGGCDSPHRDCDSPRRDYDSLHSAFTAHIDIAIALIEATQPTWRM